MASLLSIVEKHGLPCQIKCTTRGVLPFTIIKDNGDKHFLVEYDKEYHYMTPRLILKECPSCDDYEYDGSK